MVRVAILGSILLLSCGHGVTLVQSVHAARQGLHGVAIASDEAADEWAAQVDDRIAYCRGQNLPTPQQREACLGPWGQGEQFEDDLTAFKAAYDDAAEALQQLEAAARRLEDRTTGIIPQETTP